MQSPFIKDYSYLYLEKTLFDKINTELNLTIGVYSEKRDNNDKKMLSGVEVGCEYDAAYKYFNGNFILEKLRKR